MVQSLYGIKKRPDSYKIPALVCRNDGRENGNCGTLHIVLCWISASIKSWICNQNGENRGRYSTKISSWVGGSIYSLDRDLESISVKLNSAE